MKHASDDEDTRSARPVTRGAKAAAPAAQPLGSTLSWGLVGSLHRVEPLTVVPGQSGVVRLVPNTIQYSKPPLDVTWFPVKSEPGRYEMSWPDDPTAVRTLAHLGSDCRQHAYQHPLSPDHALARELDQAIYSLCKQAEKLKRAGWGVGLLTVGGVMLQNTANGVEVALVDLGFTWKGDFGDPPWDASPGKPAWLVSDELENPVSAVWDRPPVEQQFAQPSGNPFPPPAPGSSVRTLAKVIAWTLTGKPSRTLPRGQTSPLWQILDDAVQGNIESPKELLEALQEHRPSSHFYAPPKPVQLLDTKPKKNSPLLAIIIVGVVLAVLAALAALFLLKGTTPTSTTPTTDTTPSTSSPPTEAPPTSSPPTVSNDDAMKLYNQAKGVLDKLKAFANVSRNNKGNPAAEAERTKLFNEWITECEKEINLSADATQRGVAGQRLRQLVDQYEKLHQEFPPSTPATRDQEKQWLEQYNREAELLGWPR